MSNDIDFNEGKNSIKQELTSYSENLKNYTAEGWNQFPSIDLYMDQVVTYLESLLNIFNGTDVTDSKVITSSMVNNYVKEGYLKRPINKKYNREHLATLYIMSMLKPILPIPLIADSLSNFESISDYQTFFEDYGNMQNEAFKKVAEKVSISLGQYAEDDTTALRLFALQLSSEANAYRIAAEKILCTIKERELSEQTDKSKNKQKEKVKAKDK